jgi:hypothetical protein
MDIITHILTFVAGMGAGWTLKVVITNRSSKSSRSSIVSQKGNRVKGDMVAGDMNKNNRK